MLWTRVSESGLGSLEVEMAPGPTRKNLNYDVGDDDDDGNDNITFI
jgi:hypothetical protein